MFYRCFCSKHQICVKCVLAVSLQRCSDICKLCEVSRLLVYGRFEFVRSKGPVGHKIKHKPTVPRPAMCTYQYEVISGALPHQGPLMFSLCVFPLQASTVPFAPSSWRRMKSRSTCSCVSARRASPTTVRLRGRF